MNEYGKRSTNRVRDCINLEELTISRIDACFVQLSTYLNQ